MLCIGSVYAWSIIAAELIDNYNISSSQSQVIFGVLIAMSPVTMIFVGHFSEKIKHKYFGFLSALLFFSGYLLASHSQGNFLVLLIGIGFFAGMATGLGYWISLNTSVQWFPGKKGLVAGIAAAGFGLGAVFLSEISDAFLGNGYDIMQLLKIVGILYGLIIFIFSNLIFQVHKKSADSDNLLTMSEFINSPKFRKLIVGMFLGTFAGLLIIGSLSLIGAQSNISVHNLAHGVALFAFFNFLGRLVWGFLSDYLGASFSIFCSLLFQSLSIILLNIIDLSDISYLALASLTGFGFGANFVLFAKETAEVFGLKNMGVIYSYVFIGYAIAGIAGPVSGGFLFDYTGSFSIAIILASGMSLLGSLLFLVSLRGKI